jgi:cbb3-type cytochrome oxidase cytochrome c subunit
MATPFQMTIIVSVIVLIPCLPQLIRRFDFELVNTGKYVVAGGVAYNREFIVNPKPRD